MTGSQIHQSDIVRNWKQAIPTQTITNLPRWGVAAHDHRYGCVMPSLVHDGAIMTRRRAEA